MDRTPPKKVRQQLRQEVGFGCPISDCGSPYLTWHHFDPPWNVRQHHTQAGMIALCPEHHQKADKGTWVPAQLRGFKRAGKGSRRKVKGRFDWMRRRLLGVAGGNFVLDVPILFYASRQPIIWFTRDDNGYLKVNLRRPLTDRTAESVMEDNDWVVDSDMADIECPPGGHLLAVTYPNGDSLRVEFRNLLSTEEALRRYPDGEMALSMVESGFPVVAVEFQVKLPALGISIGPDKIVTPRHDEAAGNLAVDCAIGFALGEVVHPGGVALHLGPMLPNARASK